MVRVNLYAAARDIAGAAKFDIAAESLGAVLAQLRDRDARFERLLPTCSYLINGQAADELLQPLRDGDVVEVLPQFAGG